MVHKIEEERIVMPVIYTRNYMADLMELNEDMYHVYIDSHVETGERQSFCVNMKEVFPLLFVRTFQKTALSLPRQNNET